MSGPRISVGLLFGGESPEHEVSIVSARSIASRLDPARFELRAIGISRDGVWVVRGEPLARLAAGERPERGPHAFLPLERGAEDFPLPDVFFVAIHGAGGEDGTLQGYLEQLHRPYTGAGVLAMAAGMDKWIAKRLWESEGLPVVPYVGVTEERWARDAAAVLAETSRLGLPLFVKPANLGSSIGVEKVKEARALPEALGRAFGFDRRVVVERGIDAREIEVAVLGGDDPLVSVPGEVLVAGEFYDFQDKYIGGKSRTQVPAELPAGAADELRRIARAAFRAIDGYGMARVDFFLDRRDGSIWLNEINLVPGFTSISMFPKLMEASGVPYPEQIARLIEMALARGAQLRAKQRTFVSGSKWYA